MKQRHFITIDSALCIGCGLCKQDCPVNNVAIVDKKASIITQDCIQCAHCVAICPKAAVSMSGFDEPPTEITEPVLLDSQQLLQALKTRRSIRQFKNQDISKEVIDDIIEAGRLTPTAKNAQELSYIVLGERKDKCERIAVSFFRRLQPLAGLFYKPAKRIVIDDNYFFKKAPVVIIVLSPYKLDGALAASNMELMAEAHRLGVLYSGFFTVAASYSRRLRKELNLTRKDKIATTLVLGYPDVKYLRTAPKESATIRSL